MLSDVTARSPRFDIFKAVLHQDIKMRQNVGKHLPIDTTYHPIRLKYSPITLPET